MVSEKDQTTNFVHLSARTLIINKVLLRTYKCNLLCSIKYVILSRINKDEEIAIVCVKKQFYMEIQIKKKTTTEELRTFVFSPEDMHFGNL